MTDREMDPERAAETVPVPAIAVPAAEEPVGQDDPGPSRGGCRTELHGWAGGHLHGAVRPRRRAAGRGRPPGRWC